MGMVTNSEGGWAEAASTLDEIGLSDAALGGKHLKRIGKAGRTQTATLVYGAARWIGDSRS